MRVLLESARGIVDDCTQKPDKTKTNEGGKFNNNNNKKKEVSKWMTESIEENRNRSEYNRPESYLCLHYFA